MPGVLYFYNPRIIMAFLNIASLPKITGHDFLSKAFKYGLSAAGNHPKMKQCSSRSPRLLEPGWMAAS